MAVALISRDAWMAAVTERSASHDLDPADAARAGAAFDILDSNHDGALTSDDVAGLAVLAPPARATVSAIKDRLMSIRDSIARRVTDERGLAEAVPELDMLGGIYEAICRGSGSPGESATVFTSAIGDMEMRAGHLGEATKRYAEVVRLQPDNADAAYMYHRINGMYLESVRVSEQERQAGNLPLSASPSGRGVLLIDTVAAQAGNYSDMVTSALTMLRRQYGDPTTKEAVYEDIKAKCETSARALVKVLQRVIARPESIGALPEGTSAADVRNQARDALARIKRDHPELLA